MKETTEEDKIAKRKIYSKRYRDKYPDKIKEDRKKNKERYKAYRLKWATENPEEKKLADRRYWLKNGYGITLEEFERLLNNQKGICPVCGLPFKEGGKRRPFIDHSHETGQVRGLLHHKCNSLLGFADEDIRILTGAIEYLKRHTLYYEI